MKKVLSLIAAVAFSTFTFANPVNVTTAKQFATNFLTQHGLNTSFELALANPQATNSTHPQAVYIFNVQGGNGFVMIAADDNVKPVLAYSTESNFDMSNHQALYFLNRYTKEINYVVEHNIAATNETKMLWANGITTNRAKSGNSIAPLLHTTWDQGNYYNNLCPTDANSVIGNHKVPTGCVATAVAQVMKYWKYPAHGYSSNTYSAWGYGTQTFDFANFTFLWDDGRMPNNVTSLVHLNINESVDTLMYAVGVALNMGYGAAGSGACVVSSDCSGYGAEYALRKYFQYDGNLKGLKENANDSVWIGMLENELNHARPIIYAGSDTASQEGHCFIFDGYNTNDFFHVNWGWSGACNGYYDIHHLAPSGNGSPGTGAGNGVYNNDEEAIFGVAPPPTIQLASNIAPAAQTVSNGQPFNFSVSVKNISTGYDYVGNLAAIITDNSGNFIGLVKFKSYKPTADSVTINHTATLVVDSISAPFGLNGIPAGTYNVAIYDMTIGAPTWIKSNDGSFTNAATITFTGASGINNIIKDADITMAPNPANNVLKIENTSAFGIENIVILNMQGQVISETTPSNSHNFSVDLDGINSGMYLVKIVAKQGGELNKKLVIQK